MKKLNDKDCNNRNNLLQPSQTHRVDLEWCFSPGLKLMLRNYSDSSIYGVSSAKLVTTAHWSCLKAQKDGRINEVGALRTKELKL